MKNLTLPIGALMLLMLVLAAGCAPTSERQNSNGADGATATLPAAYPGGDVTLPAIEPIPVEGTRPYPSLDDRPLESLPTPAASEPELPGSGAETPVIGEVPPDLLEQVIADLMQRSDVARAAVQVLQAEQVVWPDGSMGCPQPGQMYTQALVDGYHVILEQGGERYDYRVAQSGYFFLCENGLNLGTPTG